MLRSLRKSKGRVEWYTTRPSPSTIQCCATRVPGPRAVRLAAGHRDRRFEHVLQREDQAARVARHVRPAPGDPHLVPRLPARHLDGVTQARHETEQVLAAANVEAHLVD